MPVNVDQTSAYPKPQTLLEDWPQIARSADWEPGQQLGPYVLKQRLGKGGMGVVWLAEQLTPLKRYVAIKLMPHEQRSAIAEAYFEIERQALAQLSHRAIAQIYDAGRLPDGALFFAMEYVPGAPLDQYQREHPLRYSQLAKLFVQIATGVQHAHQRGLIHRDLKPLNVLVHEADGEALPKIIDFGIAMGSTPGAAMKIDQTRSVGTPAYMSPEQKRPNDLGIDARTDIYALGMMLAESLARCGGLSTETGAIDSTVFANAVQKRLGRAIERGIDSGFIDKSLTAAPKELLAIAAKALAPDRDARYDSASGFADDLSRWLQRRPVQAYSQSRGYVFACLVRRNRVATVAITLIASAILGGTLLALHGMRQAQVAQALAEERRNDAERLIQYMLGDFADKLRPIGRLELLDGVGKEALNYLGAATGSDEKSALIRARALRTLGEVQVTRQQFDEAEKTLTQAAKLLEVWRTKPADEEVYFEAGNIAFWLGSIAYRRQDYAIAKGMWSQYLADASAFAERHSDLKRGQHEISYALNNLGTLANTQFDYELARTYFTQSAEIKRRIADDSADDIWLDVADSLSWLATAELELGRPGDAWTHTVEALDILEKHAIADIGNARNRSIRANQLYALARQAEDAELIDIAIANLANALTLAKADVANDGTRPRRQAMLARIAFELARLDHIQTGPLIEIGKEAFTAASSMLPKQEVQELNLLLAIAKAQHDPSSDSLGQLVTVLDQVASSGETSLVTPSCRALKLLSDRRRDNTPRSAEPILALAAKVPVKRQASLRYRLALRDCASAESENETRDSSIEAMQASVRIHTNKGEP